MLLFLCVVMKGYVMFGEIIACLQHVYVGESYVKLPEFFIHQAIHLQWRYWLVADMVSVVHIEEEERLPFLQEEEASWVSKFCYSSQGTPYLWGPFIEQADLR